jgi:hypothetical protein
MSMGLGWLNCLIQLQNGRSTSQTAINTSLARRDHVFALNSIRLRPL